MPNDLWLGNIFLTNLHSLKNGYKGKMETFK